MLKITQTRINLALASEKAGKELVAAIGSRTALTKGTHKRLVVALTSEKLAKEIEACIISGAALKADTQKACLVTLGGYTAGNDFINAIQTVAPVKPVKL